MKKLAVIIPCLLLAADRLLKWYAETALPTEGVVLVPGLRLFLYRNQGLIFSLSVSDVALVVSGLAFMVLIIFCVRYLRGHAWTTLRPKFLAAGLLVLLGGMSNLIDRIIFGSVTDYFLFFNRSAVNVADGMVLAGIIAGWYARDKAKGGN